MLDLKEIIWEITAKCNNGCSYCGSAGVTKTLDNPTDDDLITIAKEIALYPPEEINISGGDPTLVDVTVHKEIVRIFKEANIIPKILINPISFSRNGEEPVLDIINLYDAIGISVNTEEEYLLLNGALITFGLDMNKVTIISNFNKSNLWMFDNILSMASKHNRPWQVMVTMFPLPSDDAIYESDLAVNEFFSKIRSAQTTFNKLILADNINAGQCTAGTHSLGILYTGDVVPCLSMRAWDPDIDSQVQGNLLNDSTLRGIWENNFKEQRFGGFKCCQDHCNNIGRRKDVQDVVIPGEFPDFPDFPKCPTIPKYPNKPNDWPPRDIVMVYGVSRDNTTCETNPTPYNGPSWEELAKLYGNNDKRD